MPSLLLDSPFFVHAVEAGLLVGSPQAGNNADPFVLTNPERRRSGLPFVFSDIPEREFRAPKEALSFAHRFNSGGLKS